MHIDRVILSSNNSEKYLDFWNIVSESWVKIANIRPTLFVVSEKDLGLNTKYGEVYYQNPLGSSDISTASQSQILRLFAASKFSEEICLISDLDMMPLQYKYFHDQIKPVPDDNIVFYSSDAYLPNGPSYPAFPMCYMLAKGKTFEEILGATYDDFSREMIEWMGYSYGWFTDEKVFYKKWNDWIDQSKRTTLLRRGFNISDAHTMKRIDRAYNSFYDKNMLRDGYYVDYHMPRPYSLHKNLIDRIYNICLGGILKKEESNAF
ncbi:MAG: hypothetical protein H8E55_15945 [Pelagibacterales bacterium]|nr:hypothetical protein [Pelagibacterales bacterium]